MWPDMRVREGWVLASPANSMTLEDVFRCVVAAQPGRVKATGIKSGALNHEVGLLMMQATMAINQSVSQHLRRFSLDRLTTAASNVTSFDAHYRRRPPFEERPDLMLNA